MQIPLLKRVLQGLTLRQLGAQLWRTVSRGGPFDVAAELTYWCLLALFPFAMVVLTLTAYLPLHGLDDQLLQMAHQLMPGDAATLFESTVRDVVGKQRGWLLGLALVGALWTASGGVSGAITALNKAWEVEETRPYWKTKLLALGMVFAVTILLIIALSALIVGPEIGHKIFAWFRLGGAFDFGWKMARWPIVVLAMLLLVDVSYWLLPNVKKRRFRFMTPGAAVATVLWIATSLGFGVYAAKLGGYSKVYGTLGAAVVLMTWLYLSSVVVILGGVLNGILDRAVETPSLSDPPPLPPGASGL